MKFIKDFFNKYFKTVSVFVFAVSLAFVLGLAVGGSKASAGKLPSVALMGFSTTPPENVDFSPVWKAWHVIEEKFVPTPPANSTSTKEDLSVTDQEKVWGMISGLAASLKDPYTVFLPPEENEIFQEDISGSFEGVGMEIAIRDGILTVVAPLKDTPAFRAGMKAKDRIIEIDGKSTEGMSLQSAVKLIRGPKGTKVTLTVLREGESEPLKISIIRDKIDIPTIKTTKRKDGIFVIELYSFTEKSPELFREALQEFIDSGYDKLILDLRGNPGGYLSSAVDMASWFLPEGSTVVTEDYGENKKKTVHRSRGYNIFNDKLKFVILIDKGSASASEILAGSLRDYKKATLVGTNSFGKGSVQELVPITKDTSLKVTVARWILPNGEYIGGEGITPDIEVELSEKDKERLRNKEEGFDPILTKAVEFLQNK